MKKIVSLALAVVLLLSLSTGALAAGQTEDIGTGENAPFFEHEFRMDELSRSFDPIVRECGQFLLDEIHRMKTMSVDELNSYLGMVEAGVSSGFYSKWSDLSAYVEDFYTQAKTEHPEKLEELKAFLEEKRSELEAYPKSGVFSKWADLIASMKDFYTPTKHAVSERLERLKALLEAKQTQWAPISEAANWMISADSDQGWVKSFLMTWLALKIAWLAAAQLARLFGYPCAATLVEYSALGLDYAERNGQFREEIEETAVYQACVSQITSGRRSLGKRYVIEFSKKESKDLYYALHMAGITFQRTNGTLICRIDDLYDFKYERDLGSAFTKLVNNSAWLCANLWVLYAIDVNIVIC